VKVERLLFWISC